MQKAQAQVGTNGVFCSTSTTNGLLELNLEPAQQAPAPDFSAGLIGTFDSLIGGPIHGGMDWMHVDSNAFSTTPTNKTGSQLISWWSQKGARNTHLQVTNAIGNQQGSTATWVLVHIFDESCQEIRTFCDFYTEFDTHVYNFGDLISNSGADVPDGNLQGKEGFVTVTAVDGCPVSGQAKFHNWLSGNTFIKSLAGTDYMYGLSAYQRQGICNDQVTNTGIIPCDNILDGSQFKFLEPILPSTYTGLFNAPANTAGADVVAINFYDEYLPVYSPQAASVNIVAGIWNDLENFDSCGELLACYIRLGINDTLILSDNLTDPSFPPTTPPSGPTPSPRPTSPPTLGPSPRPPLPPGTLVKVTEEPEGANCASGGLRIDTGADDNRDGNLQESEIDETFYVCKEPGSLIEVSEEPPGENCEFGGQRIDTGIDDNEDGVLQDNEIDDTEYVCNGDPGDEDGKTLVDIIRIEPGEDSECPSGGIRVVAGTDSNGNGELEENEIETSEVVCNGQDGQNAGTSSCSLSAPGPMGKNILSDLFVLLFAPAIIIFARRYKKRIKS